MLLIIELFLAWKARRNGWGPKAFMPIGISLGSGFLIGFIGGGDLIGLALLVDIICTVWLGSMAFRAREKVADTYTAAGTPHSSGGYTYALPDTSHGNGSYTSGEEAHNGRYNTPVSPPVVVSGGSNYDTANVGASLRNQPINLDDLVITGYGSKASVSGGPTVEGAERTVTCSVCGYTNSADARYCNDCGEGLSAST